MKFSWIPYAAQIGKLLKMILPSDMVVPILQGKLRGKKWLISSSNIECALGSYEYEKRVLFERIVSNSSVVYDIGAHVGFYTLLASQLVGVHGKVIAFEPVPRNLIILKKHLEMNHCTNVVVIEAAVSDKSGICSFSEGSDSSTGRLSEEGQLTVNTVSIDDLAVRSKIPIPDYIKIDAEGAELVILKGAQWVLRNYNPKIFLATHGHKIQIDCCNFLTSLNYKLNCIATREIFAYIAEN